jgi:hypothetical protein
MTQTREAVAPAQAQSLDTRTANKHLLQLADEACAKAERSRQRWHMVRRTNAPEVAARVRRQGLKHQAIAYYLDAECQGCHERR